MNSDNLIYQALKFYLMESAVFLPRFFFQKNVQTNSIYGPRKVFSKS